MPLPEVTVVTISFNQAQFLPRLLDSIHRNQECEFEHIVVDPGSNDGSRELLQSYESSSLRLIFEDDDGPANGLNNGFEGVGTEYVTYLNADDAYAPGGLDTLVQHGATGADVVVGNGWLIDERDRPVKPLFSDRFSPFRSAAGFGTIVQQSTLYRTSSLPGPRPFNEQSRYTWDVDLLCALSSCSFAYIPEVVAYFRLYEGTVTGTPENRDAIADERRKLMVGQLGKEREALARVVKPGARAVKRLRTIKRERLDRPTFPGWGETNDQARGSF
ncbi:glycosyltransferase [Nocardioides sp. 31GB23]|uniref:glycosyltransferase n=1 Tax=Nocardioides sp. 31GB23 TaxID=3156065 RepID=UPI0032AEB23C